MFDESDKHRFEAQLEINQDLETENARLRDWIRHESETSDICTYSILREVCKGCQCEKAV